MYGIEHLALLAKAIHMPRLKSLAPMVRPARTGVLKPEPKIKLAFYDSPAFRAWRAQVVARAGNRCEAIEDGHRCSKAHPQHRMYADHRVELKDGGKPLDLANGQCLCASHHERKTHAVRRDGPPWSGSFSRPSLPRPGCRVKLVCGPPAAGKTTYVRNHARADDIIIDLDVIAEDHGVGRVREDNVLLTLLRRRNDRLAALAREPRERMAWVIINAPTQQLRKWWCSMLGVAAEDMVLLLPARGELQRRVHNDPSRKAHVDQHLMWIDRWLARELGFWPS